MAKRFTDTNKWKDTWFQDLPNKYKLFWIYLLDECDAAGIWKPNMRLAQFQVGEPFEEVELKRVFADRISITDDGYWFISKFIEFQYGELSNKSKPHISVLRLLEKHKIKGYTKGIHTLKDKDKDKEEDKDKDTYANAQEFLEDIQKDELYLEGATRLIRSFGIHADVDKELKNLFIRFVGVKTEKINSRPKRSDLRNHFLEWIPYQFRKL